MTNDDIKKEDVLDEENLEKDETEEIENEEGSEEVKEEASDEDEKYKNLMDKFMRLQADFSNYKRRTETQKSEFVELGVKKIVNDLLPVIDNFERAMDSIGDKDSTYDGIRMIKDQLTDVLKNEGIVEMKALGEEFDPMYHHAVLTEDSDEYESGYVIEVLQKGYLIDDKTLRPAMVKVSQ
ncbi:MULTISPECIES: nucleotide exchange factor GrpE [Peptoniphilus]|uniref:nucleotide exchange factor GrpE n=1 Tax=Peptoniphilus TaxID=162289 RepID=UPI0002888C84|nr:MULTISPECIES: nucleotide exchange factor GrpE [Peptoniphilus]MBS6610997.1 nucleotide exchange factor GrpE [Peptoniphilus harei]MDU1043249.1 nucleotide exchange factor GrpE [Peptoniphilus rhinitidis]MDU1953966.1 nucleotide exchange factor GrpE [Peptoniphilus lacydonensis]MDU2110811.1 nucleotide exchange factor GrpE [Peptoniphilus lacydonensis]MDU2115204.1 nucleotide exchange factor GrpE [Peptoniphilus lacydonensis]